MFFARRVLTGTNFSTSAQSNVKVAVCGAAGGIGQPLSLLLKHSPLVTQLNLYDVVNTPGVAADLSHIDTPATVRAFQGSDQLDMAFKGMEVIVIPAGLPRKPGMTRNDLLSKNAGIIQELFRSIACQCPKALVAIITNPVNAMVPIASLVMQEMDKYDPNRIFGVTTLDVVRASTFLAEATCSYPKDVNVPVIGGHAGITIIPLLSHCKQCANIPAGDVKQLVARIQDAGTEVVKAKAGKGSATLSMAYAGARFVLSLVRAVKGEKNIIECAYVKSCVTEAAYFANPIKLGKNGVEENLGLPGMDAFERGLLRAGIVELQADIQGGEDLYKELKKQSFGSVK